MRANATQSLDEPRFEICDRYVLVSLPDRVLRADEILSTMQSTIEVCRKTRITRGIIYRRRLGEQTASTTSFYHFASFLEKQNLLGYRFALAFPKAMHGDQLQFFQTAAMNRGVTIELFCDLAAAEQWITSD